jgi:hypothetical protein
MARTESLDQFKPGRLGELVYYTREGKRFVKLYQPVVKQTEATVMAAKIFGRAMVFAKHLRHGIIPIMHDPKDRAIMYRMNKAVLSWLKTPSGARNHDRLEHLYDLDINEMRRVRLQINVDWTEPGKVSISFQGFNPKQNLKIKRGTTHLVWKLAVTGVTCAPVPQPVPVRIRSSPHHAGTLNYRSKR